MEADIQLIPLTILTGSMEAGIRQIQPIIPMQSIHRPLFHRITALDSIGIEVCMR
jgi:hypothetical protein